MSLAFKKISVAFKKCLKNNKPKNTFGEKENIFHKIDSSKLRQSICTLSGLLNFTATCPYLM